MNQTSISSRRFRTSPLKRASHSRRRGAALLEFALVAAMFLMLLTGMLQFGIYLSTTNSLWNLSREGARYASVQRSDSATVSDNNTRIENHIKKPAPDGMLPPNIDPNKMTVTITPTAATSRSKGTEVKITIAYDMRDKLFLPMGGLLNKNYTTTTTMMVE
ncbi:pilus assembly protein [bacterium]|nr:MAG: pilus assembly protein [bacterium]